jgi:hypothetical protein
MRPNPRQKQEQENEQEQEHEQTSTVTPWAAARRMRVGSWQIAKPWPMRCTPQIERERGVSTSSP